MRKAKALAAIVTIVAMLLGMFTLAHAEEYKDLDVKSVSYYDQGNIFRGNFPAIAGMGDLNKEIETKVWQYFNEVQQQITTKVDEKTSFMVEYEVVNTERFAKVVLSINVGNASLIGYKGLDDTIYYIDKDGMKKIDKAAYEKGLEDQLAEAVEGEDTSITAEEYEAIIAEIFKMMDDAGIDRIPIVNLYDLVSKHGFEFVFDNIILILTNDDTKIEINIEDGSCKINGESIDYDFSPFSAAVKVEEESVYIFVPLFFFEFLGITPETSSIIYPPAEGVADEAAEAEEGAEAEEAAPEVEMVQLAKYAAELGYELGWNAELRMVSLSRDGSAVTTITIDENKYMLNGDEIQLESAPVIFPDNRTYVPVSFFVKVLGATYSVDENGEIVFTDDYSAEDADAEDAEEVEEAADEDAAEEEVEEVEEEVEEE